MVRESRLILKFTYHALKSAGVNIDKVLDAGGFDKAAWTSATLEGRFNHNAHFKFWPLLEEVSQDPCIGLTLAKNLTIHANPTIVMLLMTSPTMRLGIERVSKYICLMTEAFEVELVDEGDESYSAFTFKDEKIASIRHVVDGYFGHSMRSIMELAESKPLRVELTHDGGGYESCYEEFFGCPVTFNAAQNRCYLDLETLDKPLVTSEPSVYQAHEKLADQQISRIKIAETVQKVKKIISAYLESGEITLKLVASKLDMSTNQLRTQLASQDTSLSQLVAERRESLSKYLLAETDESIDQIVYLTGFSEPSTFYRAFKRWTNMTPVNYRDENQDISKVISQ